MLLQAVLRGTILEHRSCLASSVFVYTKTTCVARGLLGAAQTHCSASCRCRLRVFAKRSFSTPQECAAITERDVCRDWDCIPTSRTRTANLQGRACSGLCAHKGTACRCWSNQQMQTGFFVKRYRKDNEIGVLSQNALPANVAESIL